MIKQDDSNFLRFEFYSSASNTNVLAATFVPGPSTFPLTDDIVFNQSIGSTGIAPLYMRVNRSGDQWTQSYSTDGINWDPGASFTHSINVSAVGTYAGNAGGNPAHTSSVDYFFNTVLPVSNEDAPCTEWLGTIDSNWGNNGNWTISKPDQSMSAVIPDVGGAKGESPVINGSAESLNLIVENEATVEIGVNGMLTVHGIFQNNGSLTIHSDETGTGSFLDLGLIAGTGTANLERYLTEDQWHYVSAPVDDPIAGIFLGMYMMQWDEPSGEWSYITDPDYVMSTDMEGFAVWTNDIGTVTFSGDLNTGTKSFNATNTSGATHNNRGFCFTCNPYPSAVNWNIDDGSGWIRTVGNIDPTIYIWNGTVGNYGVYVKDNSTGTNDVDSIIPSQQGFFIHCSEATGFIAVDDGARLHHSKDVLKESKITSDPILKLKVAGNNLADELLIVFDENSTADYDKRYDALKFRGDEVAPQFYSLSKDNVELSVNAFANDDSYKIIPLGLEVGSYEIYTLSVENMIGFEPFEKIYLEDLKTGAITKVEAGVSYSYTAGPEDEPLRFLIYLDDEFGSHNSFIDFAYIYSFDKAIYVEMLENIKGNIIIYNMHGQQVTSTTTNDQFNRFVLTEGGNYVVRVVSEKGIVTKKVLVR